MLRTEIYINNTLIDLLEDIPMAFTYSIADIREPDKRNSSFSKTITLPGSNTNNILLGNIFKIDLSINSTGTTNFTPAFNPNLKADAVVYVDKVQVFKGAIQLLKINNTDDYNIEYEIVFFGNLANIFISIGDAELSELNFDEYNHTLNKNSQRQSWDSPIGNGYVYPMVDFGINDLVKWDVKDFKPAIFLKTIIDKIFTSAGFTYWSDFFTSDFFKRLIIPFSGEKLLLTDAQITQRQFSAKNSAAFYSDFANGLNPNLNTPITINTEISDVGNVFNNATYKFTAPANGTYEFSFDANVFLRLTPSSPAYANYNNLLKWITFVKIDNTGAKIPFGSVIPNIIPNSGLISSQTNTTAVSVYLNSSIYMGTGESFYVACHNSIIGDAFQGGVSGTMELAISPGAILSNRVVNSGLVEGESIDMNSVMPQKIKQRDLLTSVFKAFNLYIEDSKVQDKVLIINTRNDFYTSGTTIDWTDKLDISQPMIIEPMGFLDARKYIYTYDEDSDYYNKKYKDRFNRLYGDRQIDVVNDFLKDTKETKLIFSPTPSVGQTFTQRVVPTIIQVDDKGVKSAKSSKMRLLYWAGLKQSIPEWNYLSSSGSINEHRYPYAGHLDDPYSSTVDLNFGVPSEIYWTSETIYYTNNNLYNKYHKQFLEEITDKNSKIITAFFRLTVSDIHKLDFRDLIFVDGNYYRLNKVIDYNPLIDGLTKVELLKIKTGTVFTQTSGSILGGIDTDLGTEESNPTYGIFQQQGENLIGNNPNNNPIWGNNNVVAASSKDVLVKCSNNYIGEFCENVSLFNSSGCTVLGGLHNVSLINCSGTIVTENNKMYVSNRDVSTATPYSLLESNFDSYTTDANTSEKTLLSYNVQPNILDGDGDSLLIEAVFICASNTNNKTVKIKTANVTSFSFSTTTSSDIIFYTVRVIRQSSSEYQCVHKVISISSTKPIGFADNTPCDFTDYFTIDVTGQNGTASASDIVLSSFTVEILKKK